jgi:flagellar protein FliS
MTKDLIQAYTARITQASKTELIVIMYEIVLEDIKAAKISYKNNDIESYNKELKHAQRFINELMGALNYKYNVSYDLMNLYIFANKAIITAMFKKTPETLDEAEIVLEKLYNGFKEISKEDTSGSVMQNTQQLYAGLTYGKGVLNETFIDPQQQNRGFMA